MTDLVKPIRRRSRTTLRSRNRRLIVALEPGDVVAIREERRRTWYRVTLESVYWLAVKAAAAKLVEERKLNRKNRKDNR